MYKLKLDRLNGKLQVLRYMRMPWEPHKRAWFIRKEFTVPLITKIADKLYSFNATRRLWQAKDAAEMDKHIADTRERLIKSKGATCL
jgi:hypothetical protein